MLRLIGRELLFGEAKPVFAEIILLFDSGGEKNYRDRLPIPKLSETLRVGFCQMF